MYKHKDGYDFSEYPDNSTYYNKENNRVVGKFNDECKDKSIAEFVGL